MKITNTNHSFVGTKKYMERGIHQKKGEFVDSMK